MAYENDNEKSKPNKNKCTIVQTQASTVTVQQFTNEKMSYSHNQETIKTRIITSSEKKVVFRGKSKKKVGTDYQYTIQEKRALDINRACSKHRGVDVISPFGNPSQW